ncbi:hypothetical protein LMG19087_01767 [Ralstonia wenshanensis]|jgi:hypothetical protein|uniref:hypothetical protein n=1 Tax=Ralstonia wenshanensis TaxID=2842456 RepID=UPI0028F5CB9D|nr:hypothetical protein [Ralstonia wenshanensis]CAJ0813466.1 hypothetical protein LMG19087_01767 [Ralstonia wenshanensis]
MSTEIAAAAMAPSINAPAPPAQAAVHTAPNRAAEVQQFDAMMANAAMSNAPPHASAPVSSSGVMVELRRYGKDMANRYADLEDKITQVHRASQSGDLMQMSAANAEASLLIASTTADLQMNYGLANAANGTLKSLLHNSSQ